MKTHHRLLIYFLSLLLIVTLTGCSELFLKSKNHYASSTVNYLYPDKEVIEKPTIPSLSLPLRVGVAFVPETGSRSTLSHLSEKDKYDLMERIASEFKTLEFVKEIEIIPSAYLTKRGSFTNLDQIKTMYGIDIITLLSYDQVQHTDEGLLSLSYWTIVGAYLVKGERNDTNTMLDAALYDISSRKMLFRAPGISHIKGSATLVNLSEKLREDSLASFHAAADNLVVNLREELERFRQKVKDQPEEYIIEHKAGYSGGAAIESVFALILVALAGVALWRERKP